MNLHQHLKLEQKRDGQTAMSDSMVPLSDLLDKELMIERIEKVEKVKQPTISVGVAEEIKKGEDYTLVKLDYERIRGDPSSTFGAFGIFDGHNGSAAAVYTKENLLENVLSCLPPGLSRDEWLAALPRALVAGFVRTDRDFQTHEQPSGSTATFVVVDRWTVTVASVGDSRCILDCPEGVITLTVDHRYDDEEERERVKASGGEVGRLSTAIGAEFGPLRCWPGGLCLSRSIGDADVGDFIVPIPFVKQVKLPKSGGRLIIASDGVWDALSSEKAAKCCRDRPAEIAAQEVVKETLKIRGLRDDTTCIVVDICLPSLSSSKRQKKGFNFGKQAPATSSPNQRPKNVGRVLQIFEEGSAVLAERLGLPAAYGKGLKCYNCQSSLHENEANEIHIGPLAASQVRPWQGGYLCQSCREQHLDSSRTSRDR